MAWGRQVPEGNLPVFSVGSMEEAESLIVLTCGTNMRGEYVARELVMEQTLENLYAFGHRLAAAHEKFFRGTAKCVCKPKKKEER